MIHTAHSRAFWPTIAAGTLLLLALTAARVHGAPLFRAPFRSYTIGMGANTVALADLNEDGKLDVVAGFDQTVSLAIMLGHGDGDFDPPSFVPAYDYTASITTADLNADGHADVITGSRYGPGVSVYLGHGDGTLAPRVDVVAGQDPRSVAIADANHDGKLDLIVSNSETFYGRAVSVLLGNGDGTFQSRIDNTMVVSPSSVAAADFNEDGGLDLVAGVEGGATFIYTMRGDGTGHFDADQSVASGYGPVRVVTGDLDEDGHQDIAAGASYSGDASIHYGIGDGTFAARVSIPIGGATSLTLADFDGDGHVDVVTPAAVMLGHGDRTFDAPSSFLTDFLPSAVATGDVDGDGINDLVTASLYPGTISILKGAGGDGLDQSPSYATGRGPYGIVAADLTGDGVVDLAVPATTDRVISILRGIGDGRFAARTDLTGSFAAAMLQIGDLNHDGNADLVTTGYGSISTLLGDGSGGFAPAQSFSSDPGTRSFALGDLNHDGFPDVVTANGDVRAGPRDPTIPGTTVSVFLGNGTGALGAPVAFGAGGSPIDVAVADLNHDGDEDLVVANIRTTTVSVLLGNGDGTFQPDQEYATNSYPVRVVVADFDGNGDLDVITGGSTTLQIQLGNGTGSLGAPIPIAPGALGIIQWIGAGDWDGNGSLDLALTRESANTVHLLFNAGNGTFASHAYDYGIGQGGMRGVVADLDGNGRLDIAVANFYDHTITPLLALGGSAPTAITLALGPVTTWPGGARLEWHAAERPAGEILAERRGGDQAWRTLGPVQVEGDRLIVEDLAATPGARYFYRLRGADVLTPEVQVDIPGAVRLALHALTGGASRGAFGVGLSLTTSQPARLDVYDAAGRRLASRRIEGVMAGEHHIEMPEAESWKAGIYFGRLVQGERTAQTKWLLAR